jgi:lysophospholipid acyltransferase (LPLAT)-like uncharacterized protein
MKLRSPTLFGLGALCIASVIRRWMSTCDYRMTYYDATVDPFHPDHSGHGIYVLWHEYLLLPVMVRSHSHLALLLSRHADAEILARVTRHYGFECVRGSSNKGSVAALNELFEKSRSTGIAITPDGPRGPRRTMSQGPIFLASRLQMPLISIGLGIDRPWRLNSWDRFAIARPGSRARAVIGPPMHLPADLDRDGIEHYRVEAERMLNRMTVEAEAWAEAGTDKVGSIPVRKEYHIESRDRRVRIDARHAQVPSKPHLRVTTNQRAIS